MTVRNRIVLKKNLKNVLFRGKNVMERGFALRFKFLEGGLGVWFSSLYIYLLKKLEKIKSRGHSQNFFQSKMPKMDSARKV